MSTRQPLANVPNGTNSPHCGILVSSKRPRTSSQFDIPYGQPPLKKQLVDRNKSDARSPSKSRSYLQGTETRALSRRPGHLTAFEKKLVAAKDKEKQTLAKGPRNDKALANEIYTVRQWQKHYRKVFPQFVFYFDSIPEDVRNKCSKQVMVLGAVSVISWTIVLCRHFSFKPES
jgi:regulatory subunit for Cdc7p protein kinase